MASWNEAEEVKGQRHWPLVKVLPQTSGPVSTFLCVPFVSYGKGGNQMVLEIKKGKPLVFPLTLLYLLFNVQLHPLQKLRDEQIPRIFEDLWTALKFPYKCPLFFFISCLLGR